MKGWPEGVVYLEDFIWLPPFDEATVLLASETPSW
jgi:hypothetical protein